MANLLTISRLCAFSGIILGGTRAELFTTSSSSLCRQQPTLIQLRGGHALFRHRNLMGDDSSQYPDPAPSIEDLEDEATDAAIDQILDHMIGNNGGTMIHPYLSTRRWLWRQWYATVWYDVAGSALRNMMGALVLCVFLRKMTHDDWRVWEFSSSNNNRLQIIATIWKSLMNAITVLLVFFVGQAYSFWRRMYETARSLQGRIEDINLLLATHVSRKKNGTYITEAQRLLEEVASLLRLYHILQWATQTRRFRILLTDRGLARMTSRGIMNIHQKETMERPIGISKTERHYIFLEWVLYKCHQARQRGVLEGGAGLEQILLEKACAVRSMSAQVAHKVHDRMPLAYTHFVQIMVDSFLFCAPLAQYAELGIFSVVSMGIYTVFFWGLMDLAKVFLDPIDNDGCVQMDLTVLIREVNGGSHRWMKGANKFPH